MGYCDGLMWGLCGVTVVLMRGAKGLFSRTANPLAAFCLARPLARSLAARAPVRTLLVSKLYCKLAASFWARPGCLRARRRPRP